MNIDSIINSGVHCEPVLGCELAERDNICDTVGIMPDPTKTL